MIIDRYTHIYLREIKDLYNNSLIAHNMFVEPKATVTITTSHFFGELIQDEH